MRPGFSRGLFLSCQKCPRLKANPSAALLRSMNAPAPFDTSTQRYAAAAKFRYIALAFTPPRLTSPTPIADHYLSGVFALS
jgi:hypothetical protein